MEQHHTLPEDGFLRLKQILRFIPVSKSEWWAGVKSGKYPGAVRISSRITAWRAKDIRTLIDTLSENKADIL